MDGHILKETFKAHKNGEVLPVPNLDDTAEFTAPLTLAEFQQRVAAWRKRAIPNATLYGQLDKLFLEAEELRAAIVDARSPEEVRHALRELCDLIIVGCNVADLAGKSLAELLDAKQTKNEQRTWKCDNSGKAQHVEEGGA
jgi:NTP pyrophosphatase (non-canonical NTP hydrolase)